MASVGRRAKRPRKAQGVPEWPAPKRSRAFRNDAIDKKVPGRGYDVGKFSFQVRDGDDVVTEIQCGDAVRINLASSKQPGIGLVDALKDSSDDDGSVGMVRIRWFLRQQDLPKWGGLPKDSVQKGELVLGTRAHTEWQPVETVEGKTDLVFHGDGSKPDSAHLCRYCLGPKRGGHPSLRPLLLSDLRPSLGD